MIPPPIIEKGNNLTHWSQAKGLQIEEDAGGKFVTAGFYTEYKIYLTPFERFEMTKGYWQKPRDYKGKKDARVATTKSVEIKQEESVEVPNIEW